jgi:hypothetical protein
MLPKQHLAALPRTREIAKDRKRELFQWRACLDDAFQAWDDAGLCHFFLTGLVEPAEVVACLEYVIRHFLYVLFC